MSHALDESALDLLFRSARTHSRFTPQAVDDDLLRRAWDLAKMGPTAANGQPARLVFIRSPEAKERLRGVLAPNNIDKTMAAPVTAIVAHDVTFFERLPELYPFADARAWYANDSALAEITAFRSGTLQAAYFILALRAVGLDAGPMSGFSNAVLDQEFFAGTPWRSNLLINIGFGDTAALRPRGPRLSFDDACKIL
jgi:3-hydroxypropanoate dehydrogenase